MKSKEIHTDSLNLKQNHILELTLLRNNLLIRLLKQSVNLWKVQHSIKLLTEHWITTQQVASLNSFIHSWQRHSKFEVN